MRATGSVVRGLEDVPAAGPTPNSAASVRIGETAAFEAARASRQHSAPEWTVERSSIELMLYLEDNGFTREVYAVEYFAVSTQHDVTRPYSLVDAHSGEIVLSWEGLTHASATGPGGNIKTGRYEYGTDAPFLEVEEDGETCTLENDKVRTIDLTQSIYNTQAYSFDCSENTYRAVNGAYSPLNDGHHFGGVIYDMYQEWLGTPPLGFKIVMRLHFLTSFENAFWNGETMTFGDGRSRFYPLVGLDIAAHEISHGFTEHNSNLTYWRMSGGINEAFSDIAGEAVEYYSRGEVDWLIGADIMKTDPALRYFEDPTLDGRSIGHADDYSNNMDVHYSSGVFNRAYFLLSNTANWDPRRAFEVFAHANQNYWTPDSDFRAGACGVLESAADLHYDPVAVNETG